MSLTDGLLLALLVVVLAHWLEHSDWAARRARWYRRACAGPLRQWAKNIKTRRRLRKEARRRRRGGNV